MTIVRLTQHVHDFRATWHAPGTLCELVAEPEERPYAGWLRAIGDASRNDYEIIEFLASRNDYEIIDAVTALGALA